MAGETKLEGIIDWINERQQEIKKLFNWPKRFPVSKTYIDALAKCDPHEIAKARAQVIVKARAGEQCDEGPSRLGAQKKLREASLIQTAVDGKILRGTLKHGREDQPPVHLLSFYECESGMVLDQFVVKSKNNEESARPGHITSCTGKRTHHECRCDLQLSRLVCNGPCLSWIVFHPDQRE
jgi:hypothetical protein